MPVVPQTGNGEDIPFMSLNDLLADLDLGGEEEKQEVKENKEPNAPK